VYSAVLRDVSDRKRAEQEQRFLAAASAVLASSLDYEATIEAVSNLPVPALAEWCTLELVEPDATFRRVTAPHANPERQWALDELHARFRSDLDSPWPTADVVRTGRAELVPTVTEDWLEARTVNEAHRELLRAAGIATLIIVPLVARHEMLGALTLARGPGVRSFDVAEEALARDLGLRAALALDSARLYRTARRATRARDEVLGVVSHDLRNPLSAIAMCVRALQESPPTSAAEREYLLDAISDSTEWMKRLIQDLLDVASIEAGRLSIERRPEEVAPIVQRTLAMFDRAAAERGVTLEARVEESLPAVFGDAGRVLQVLANLVGNALKFTDSGGRVDLTVRSRDGEVEFSVRDTGPGIPAEHLPHLFELYWHASVTTRSRGSGYGLAIARGIVDAHDGRIWVESTVGEGSTFSFSLPASAD
jgi:signal transduction histidine kinase